MNSDNERAVSLKDVARRAGVSVATVSRALHDHPRISRETKQRVQQLAAEMGYVPNETARSLVRRKTRAFGVILPDATDPYAAAVLHSIEENARRVGYALLLAHSWGEPRQELAAIQTLRERGVDGLVLISSRAGAALRPLAGRLRQPLVIVNGNSEPEVGHAVRGDNVRGAVLATSYLLRLGHRRIAFIGGPVESRSGREREAGYRQTLQAAVSAGTPRVFPGRGRLADGFTALRTILAAGEPPDGIVCYNDLTALGVLQAAWQAGLAVPEQLSVVGFDDIPCAAYSIPPLTTIAQPKAAMGRAVVDLLTKLVHSEPVEDVLLLGKLIERASCRAR